MGVDFDLAGGTIADALCIQYAYDVRADVSGAGCSRALVELDGPRERRVIRQLIDGESYVTKSISPRFDWISRATGDYVARVLTCWRLGILDALPECIDHTVVAVADAWLFFGCMYS